MKRISIRECIDEVETIIPKIMKSIQFTTLKELFDLSVNISISQFYVLLAVFHDNGCKMRALAEEMSLTPATITGLVDRLERRGLVRRQHDKQDRRAIIVWLAEKGREFMLDFEKKKNEYLATVLKKVSPEIREKLVHSLRALEHAIEELLKEKNVTPTGKVKSLIY